MRRLLGVALCLMLCGAALRADEPAPVAADDDPIPRPEPIEPPAPAEIDSSIRRGIGTQ